MATSIRPEQPHLTFACAESNDLYRVYGRAVRSKPPRFDTAREAAEHAVPGSGVLLLADAYPGKTNAVDATVFRKAAEKGLRLYVEFPTELPGIEVGTPRSTRWERAVVTSDAFGDRLPAMRILAIHDCHFVPVAARKADMVVARVAGNDTAVYGLPEETFPILLETGDGKVIVSTTKLSQFVTARYGPEADWAVVWRSILQRLAPGARVPELKWTPTVRPRFGRTSRLPIDVENAALRRGADWLVNSGLIIDRSVAGILTAENTGPLVDWPSLPAGSGVGDGSHGLFECFTAHIDSSGAQWVSPFRRGDCTGEAAMALAIGARLCGEGEKAQIAHNLLDFWYFKSSARQGEYADPSNGNYGLIGWGLDNPTWMHVVWGDDNARLLLGTIAVAALSGERRWDEAVLMCLLANLRTAGKLGFRGDATQSHELEKGWRERFNRATVNIGPHYEAYPWACYLWAYRHTGFELFRERAESAIRITMEGYPDRWRWTNGIQQERARMLLPLAWLVRVSDTKEHRAWLKRVARDLVAAQDACGAIREELGEPGKGVCEPPKSNEEYGLNETPLIQANGEPVSDLLYTTNFALLGLHEAAAATGDPFYRRAEDRLTRFLCRIQVRSEEHPELDGAWYRGFDYGRWEYWGSNADNSWGVWCTEAGWTQGWIVAVLGLRQMGTSLWDLTAETGVGRHMDRLRPLMIPEESPQ